MVAVPSGGDQVLTLHDRNLTPTMLDNPWNGVFNKCRFAWVFQEKRKGSLNRSDSYVPFILAYPGGNKAVIDEFMDKVSECPGGQCQGNWNVTDVIKEIVSLQYK